MVNIDLKYLLSEGQYRRKANQTVSSPANLGAPPAAAVEDSFSLSSSHPAQVTLSLAWYKQITKYKILCKTHQQV